MITRFAFGREWTPGEAVPIAQRRDAARFLAQSQSGAMVTPRGNGDQRIKPGLGKQRIPFDAVKRSVSASETAF